MPEAHDTQSEPTPRPKTSAVEEKLGLDSDLKPISLPRPNAPPAFLVPLLVAGGVITLSDLHAGSLPRPGRYLGLAAIGVALGVVNMMSSKLATGLGWLILAGIALGPSSPTDTTPKASTALGTLTGSYQPRAGAGAPHDLTVPAFAPGLVMPLTGPQTPTGQPPSNNPLLGGGFYTNPFAHTAGLKSARIDQGVDYSGTGPVAAIGDAIVVLAERTTGWPGGGFVSYRLTSGPQAGKTVYVAENIAPAVRPGQVIKKGQTIGNIVGGIETGWAMPNTDQAYAHTPGNYNPPPGDPGGLITAAGKAFSDFMKSLGAPGGSPDRPAQIGHYP